MLDMLPGYSCYRASVCEGVTTVGRQRTCRRWQFRMHANCCFKNFSQWTLCRDCRWNVTMMYSRQFVLISMLSGRSVFTVA